VAPAEGDGERPFDVVTLDEVVVEFDGRPHPTVGIVDRTSWSCHHGVARWSGECPDADDGRWKGPLRAGFERLAGAIDALTWTELAELPGDVDPDAARDAYVDVVVGAVPAAAFAADRWPAASDEQRARALDLLEAQRWRLAMFASDGWFWDDPVRPETRSVMRAAARAVRLVAGHPGSRLERLLVADLAQLSSPSRGLDGAAIYRMALADVDQPPPAE
jgi:hypothetical protein